ncbi:hypothetical protein, conserved [Eimeria brunetti]|uniref:Trafficking protein particle complex subunit 11 domain-containing protein n=1 Tax=Eimeria brunetti TaxID=51314 RepID=U6LLQ2_9EIME|nr:hypothetical protein, conserved [Eimeria brunetti]
MATIDFFRERLQRRIVVPKIIIFVILPTGMEDPQSAVGFLKKLNPADIAAIFITCGVDDLKAKLEKLEQVSFDCSVEYYESEARRYRKQTQVTFKGDRSQTSAFHVYQLCEDAMHTSPSSLDTRDVWQLAGFHYQAAARYLQHVRSWIRTAKEVHPPPSMKGGLGVPSEWLGQPDTLQHGTGAFATANPQDPEAAAAAAQEEVFLRFIFFFNEAQVLTHATHLLSKAHIAYKLVGGHRSCPILACELADAMFDGHKMMTARQLYFTLATFFASYKYAHQKSWQLEAVLAACSPADPAMQQQIVRAECREHPRTEKGASIPSNAEVDAGSPETLSAANATASARQPENFNQPVVDEAHLPGGSRLRLSGAGNCTGWWPLYRYVLARLTLCVSHLLSIPPAEFLHKIARVDSRFSSGIGDSGQTPSAAAAAGDVKVPSAAASLAGSFSASVDRPTGGAQADAENCHIALKASFEILNILALREDVEDRDTSKRKQMYRYIEMLVPLLRRFEQRRGASQWIFHLDLHAVAVWTDFSPELHREQMVSGSGLFVRHRLSLPQAGPESAPVWEGVKIGRVCFQHRLGFDIVVLNIAELVTSTGKKAQCLLAASKDFPQISAAEKDDLTLPTEHASVALPHGALCYCDLYLAPQELRDLSGSTVRLLQLSWALCPSVCFQLATLSSLEWEGCRLPGRQVAAFRFLESRAVPDGCWPSPIWRAIRFHELSIPPSPLCDVERPGLAEPFLPYVCLSKVRRYQVLVAITDSFKLETIEDYPSKCICIGELAPYTVRLTIKQDWKECKFSIGLQCMAQGFGSENDRTVDTSVLLEDEFESYLMALSGAEDLGHDGGRYSHTQEQTQTNGSIGLPTYPRLLRVPTNGSPCLPFTVGRDGLGMGCTKEMGATDGRERVASPWVFDPWEYRCKLSAAEWRTLAGGDGHETDRCEELNEPEGVKVVCIPMFIRLRRSGSFDIRVTVDINLDDIIQRLTTTSAVDCQRCLNLSSSLISLPSTGAGGPCEARRVNVTNVSEISLQLTDCSPDCGTCVAAKSLGRQLSVITPELPCTLLPGETWSGISRTLSSSEQAAVLLKYTRTTDYLPFPFSCTDLDIKENFTIAHLPAVVKPLWVQCLHINLVHPVTSAVGVPFAFSATLENLTREAMELVVRLSYPLEGSLKREDSGDLSSVAIPSECPFMVGGQIKTQVIILPLSTKSLNWTLVASRPGLFRLPVVLVEGRSKSVNAGLQKGLPFTTSAGSVDATNWECTSNPAHVLVFSR